jgi:hypothetical protein
MYNTVYWYCGGTERGRWNRTSGATDIESLRHTLAYVQNMGYAAVLGHTNIGPPETPPMYPSRIPEKV